MGKSADKALTRKKAVKKKAVKKKVAKKKASRKPGRRSAKESVDFQKLERDYRAGVLAHRQVAKQHGIPPSTLSHYAKKYGWTRDLSEDVRRATRTKLAQRASEEAPEREDDFRRDTVEAYSDLCVEVVERHRKDIHRARRAGNEIIRQAEDVLSQVDTAVAEWAEHQHRLYEEQQARIAANAGKLPKGEKRLDPLQTGQVLSYRLRLLGEAAEVYRRVSQPVARMIELERQAFNLDDQKDPNRGTLEELLDEISGKASSNPITRLRTETTH